MLSSMYGLFALLLLRRDAELLHERRVRGAQQDRDEREQPTAMTGRLHSRTRMLTRNRIAQITATIARKLSAGSCAFTSV